MLREGERGSLPHPISGVLSDRAGGLPVRQLSLTWASRPSAASGTYAFVDSCSKPL